jgi:acetolactate synthase-1/2/3 large subunit
MTPKAIELPRGVDLPARTFALAEAGRAVQGSDPSRGSEPRLADAVVQALLAWRVRHVFGVSGANIEHLHDAIHRLGDGKLVSVLAKSEFGAAFMADGYARVHRRLGVCCSTSGGGMMNLAVGIAESHAESVPILALVGQPPETGDERRPMQDAAGGGRAIDPLALFGGIAKFVAAITRPEDFWPTFERAIVEALSGRPGPAVLLFPRSIWTARVPPLPADFASRLRAAILPAPVHQLGVDERPASASESGSVDENSTIRLRSGAPANLKAVRLGLLTLLEDLRSARHPVLLLGQGVRRCFNPSAVLEFAHALKLPLLTDLSARGEVANDDPLYLGMVGVAGHPSAHQYLRDRADVVFLVGCGFNALTRAPFLGDRGKTAAKRILAVNIDLHGLERALRPPAQRELRSWWPQTVMNLRVAIEADAGVVCEELLHLWREEPFEVPPVTGYRLETFPPLAAEGLPPGPAPVGTLLPSEALALLQQILPRGGHIVYDAGNCAATALHRLRIPRGTSATIALGMGGMGYAIAAATGIALRARPDQRTIVFTGDGSLLMTGFEIHTAVERGLPILFVVFNNGMHGMGVTRQQKFFEGRLECVHYLPIDVASLVRGFGGPERLWVGRAQTKEQLAAALRDQAAHADRPGVLEIVLGHEEIPPFAPLFANGSERGNPPSWGWE